MGCTLRCEEKIWIVGWGAIERNIVFDPRKRTKTVATRHLFWATKYFCGLGSASNPAGEVTVLPYTLSGICGAVSRREGRGEMRGKGKGSGRKGKEKGKKKRAESPE